MGEKLYRTQVLLDPGQYRLLMEIAEKEGMSFSAKVREVLEAYLIKEEEEVTHRQQIEALQRVRQAGEAIRQEHGGEPFPIDVNELIDSLRQERDRASGS
jgi:hypothetical protein